ncbi:MAG: NTP transferase domain-containing protein, partial [Clostridiales bacterium]|nr:NTP transferase domain-containing protein [Clostridiales bacterium]
MSNREVVAMLLAGGQGSRLYDLTEFIAKPAVSFGGKYRMIDFSLSNCTNSGIDTIGVLTQYKPMLLNSYLGNGAAWDLDTSDGGLHILPPYYTEKGGNWYKGTSDAVYRNINFIDKFDPKYVIILSGDHIYNMDYNKMLAFHKNSQADLTISVTKVPLEEAPRFGILSLDDNYRITGFQEKPKYPNSNYASMGIYIFNWPILNKAL